MSIPFGREYKVRFVREMADFARDVVRLQAVDAGGSWLMPDGSWELVDPGSSIPDAGVVLPTGIIEPLAVALAAFQGHTSHADTEARVLREWLLVEQRRVDATLAEGRPK